MKKTATIILLSSALLLPNHEAEAAYTSNTVETASMNLQDQQQLKSYKGYSFYRSWLTFSGKYFHHGKPMRPNQEERPDVEENIEQEPNTPPKTEGNVEKPSTPEITPDDSVGDKKPNASVSAVEQEILTLTNAERKKAGLAPLAIDHALLKSAREKSKDMANNRYFSHTSPTYGSPFDQMASFGVKYRSAAENIAKGQRSAKEVVRAWMDSPGHRQNILTGSFTHIGIGYDANGHYWTQQFIQK